MYALTRASQWSRAKSANGAMHLAQFVESNGTVEFS